jgi:prophage regulatory protein
MEPILPKHLPLPETGLLRLASILAPNGPIPISRSTWWAGVAAGRFPQPVKLGPRTTCWRVEDIRKLIDLGPQADLELTNINPKQKRRGNDG